LIREKKTRSLAKSSKPENGNRHWHHGILEKEGKGGPDFGALVFLLALVAIAERGGGRLQRRRKKKEGFLRFWEIVYSGITTNKRGGGNFWHGRKRGGIGAGGGPH